MFILTQFLLRLSFGMATSMTVVSPRQVTSGYYRNNMYVLLGLNVLATLVALKTPGLVIWAPIAVAVLSYLGAVAWLYENAKLGMAALALVAVVSLVGAWADLPSEYQTMDLAGIFNYAVVPCGGLVLGTTMAAMLLGHWYLNAPGMRVEPLKGLIACMIVAIVLRGVLSGTSLGLLISGSGSEQSGIDALGMNGFTSLLALRWLTGVVGALVTAVMAWQTLKIPNTQSATGILYVGVMFTFLGELTAELLSSDSILPL